ncbi:hypothetical protein WDW89_21095, partial [Deltaproteobacteria bacterium TL4]
VGFFLGDCQAGNQFFEFLIGHKPFSDKRFFKQVFYSILTRNWMKSKRNFKAATAGTAEERLRSRLDGK